MPKVANTVNVVTRLSRARSKTSLLRFWNLKYTNGTAAFSLPFKSESASRCQLPQSSGFVRSSLSLSYRPDTVFILHLMTIPTKVDAQTQRSAHPTLVLIMTACFGTEFGV